MSAMSGSTPVVSQSIRKAMVPVGASTLTWPLRKPDFSPSASTSSQVVSAASSRSSGTGCSVEPIGGVAVLVHDLQVRLAVHGVAGEGAALVAADAR